jgi:hypothetical protein
MPTVIGIDGCPPAGIQRWQYLRTDLDDGIAPVIEQLGGKRFDRVLPLDVGHPKRPGVAEKSHEVSPGVVVVPNVAKSPRWLMLLFGRFNPPSVASSTRHISVLHANGAAVSGRRRIPYPGRKSPSCHWSWYSACNTIICS